MVSSRWTCNPLWNHASTFEICDSRLTLLNRYQGADITADRYTDVLRRTGQMVQDQNVQHLAREHGLQVLDV